ncbi:uncharacterized protein BHQ10_009720 [Talaromyces amestolkiae]|uniref:LysM domain-containing protein n=1 Tax=Talaromyces amestolkiae TaxID=1196081 RepID=A0A364LD24_TALAM|nr:uncharacterized protein BHQ10_009720 [Talaromyces amestolkiae]RAO73708.1 hypothetical protein BHQ10_009720 [Talaromyces amestolkiae]
MSSNTDFLDVNPAVSSASTSRRSSTAVRPRNRRLISVNNDGEEEGPQTSSTSRVASSFARLTPPQSRGTTPSPYASQRGSPLPQKQFSRVSERDLGGRYRDDDDAYGSRDTFQPFNSSHNSSGFLESSWSSIQSLTSSFLGNDLKWGKSASNSTISTKRRKPSRSDIPVSLSKQQGPSAWGPSVSSGPQIGSGTKEERQALVQAKKREILLLANGDSLSDLRDRYKRKDSLEISNDSTMDPELDEEALVYIHHIQPSDSMTGLCIKYGCQLAIFRKANGFWPSDSIQTRKIVLLPAEACSVKGRRVDRPGNVDLLGDDLSGETSSEDPAGSSIVPSESPPIGEPSESVQTTKSDNERVWKHEAWVMMEGFPSPVEIGRVPRKTLGFFPRSRRKSLSLPYSDAEPPTPTIPTRLNRIDSSSSYQRDGSPIPSTSSSRLTSPLRSSRAGHRRTSSITLQGPGGVGTLGREVHAPGPAQDGLNKFVAQHLPNLSVPPPPAPSTLRKASFDSTSSVLSGTSSTGLENFGGAIEGWMRKMAVRAKTSLNDLQPGGSQQSSRGQALGIAGLGDLIELNDGLEGGSDSEVLMGNGHTESRNGRNQAMGNYSQYERFSNSPSSTTRTRPRLDAHKND